MDGQFVLFDFALTDLDYEYISGLNLETCRKCDRFLFFGGIVISHIVEMHKKFQVKNFLKRAICASFTYLRKILYTSYLLLKLR